MKQMENSYLEIKYKKKTMKKIYAFSLKLAEISITFLLNYFMK